MHSLQGVWPCAWSTDHVKHQGSKVNTSNNWCRWESRTDLVAVATGVETPDETHSQGSTEEGQQNAQAAHVLQADTLADNGVPQHQEVRQGTVHTPADGDGQG